MLKGEEDYNLLNELFDHLNISMHYFDYEIGIGDQNMCHYLLLNT